MGKRLITQRRGRGTTTYRAPSHRYKFDVIHRKYDDLEKTNYIRGKIIDIIKCPGHFSPIAEILYENNEHGVIFAPENIKVSDIIYSGINSPIDIGNTLPLKKIPEGTFVYNIESQPGDGGSFCRTSGTSAKIISHTEGLTLVELPSKKTKYFDSNCRATIGVISGAGRLDKPFVKAGFRYHAMKARGKLYPRTSGVAMNAVDHPFGSGRGRHIGKSKVAPRNAPPGRNVGLIRSRRTGKRK